MNNRIKKIRQEKKISQRDLAQLVGVSQQQIQRFEAEISPVRLDVAVKISEALNVPLERVFPAAKGVLKRGTNPRLDDEETQDAFANAGIEADGVIWTVEVGLRGGFAKQYTLPSSDQRRLERLLLNWENYSEDNSFFCFDSEHYSVAVNLAEVNYARLMFDAPRIEDGEAESFEEAVERTPSVQVWMRGESTPLEFRTNPDNPKKEDEDEYGEIENFLLSLDTDPSGFVSFTDEDGEMVYLRAAHIALVAAPHWLLKPEMFDDEESEGLTLTMPADSKSM